MANAMNKGSEMTVAFKSIDDQDLATVGGGAGIGDLIAVPFALAQQGIQLISSLDPTGLVGTFGKLLGAASDRARTLLGGLFGK